MEREEGDVVGGGWKGAKGGLAPLSAAVLSSDWATINECGLVIANARPESNAE